MKELLTYYCRYNIWANEKLADFFSDKSEELLAQFVENSFPSIRKTVLHILSAERSWLARLQQDVDNNKLLLDEYASTKDIFDQLLATSNSFLTFIENQTEDYLNQNLTYNTWNGTAWNMPPKTMIHHCMNHSTYHRGQLITLARQLGMKEGGA